MKAFATALRRDQGATVPVPWSPLQQLIHPEPGNIGVVLAQSGIGKSTFALNWVLALPFAATLVSLDTDLRTQGVRAASILSGMRLEEVGQEPGRWAAFLERQHSQLRAYDLPGLQPYETGELIEAEKEFWGDTPSMVVIDNLSDMVESEYASVMNALNKLKQIAREHHTFILILHHSRRGTVVPLLMSGEYGGDKQSQIVLGLSKPSGDCFRVSVLKNRTGKSDPNGNLFVTLNFDENTLRVTERTRTQRVLDAMTGNRSQGAIS